MDWLSDRLLIAVLRTLYPYLVQKKEFYALTVKKISERRFSTGERQTPPR